MKNGLWIPVLLFLAAQLIAELLWARDVDVRLAVMESEIGLMITAIKELKAERKK